MINQPDKHGQPTDPEQTPSPKGHGIETGVLYSEAENLYVALCRAGIFNDYDRVAILGVMFLQQLSVSTVAETEITPVKFKGRCFLQVVTDCKSKAHADTTARILGHIMSDVTGLEYVEPPAITDLSQEEGEDVTVLLVEEGILLEELPDKSASKRDVFAVGVN